MYQVKQQRCLPFPPSPVDEECSYIQGNPLLPHMPVLPNQPFFPPPIHHLPNPSSLLTCTGLQHSHPPIPSFLLKSISIPHKTMRIIIMKMKEWHWQNQEISHTYHMNHTLMNIRMLSFLPPSMVAPPLPSTPVPGRNYSFPAMQIPMVSKCNQMQLCIVE